MKKLFKEALQIIQENWKAYLAINLLFYGLVIVGMIVISTNPKLHREILTSLQNHLLNGNGLLPFVAKYYFENNIPISIALTFLVNLFLAALIQITLPSLVIPFAGFSILIFRASIWGFIYGSNSSLFGLVLLILEGQGYILAAFAVYLYSMYMIRPKQYNFSRRKEAFIYGLKVIGKIYFLVVLVLLIAAVYEVILFNSYTRFPFHKYSKEKINLSGPEVELISSGCSVYYDSVSVTKNDAKVVGYLLEEIGYLKKGDYSVVKINKDASVIHARLYLEEKYWNDVDILRRFDGMKKSFNKMFPERQIEIIAFYTNERGLKKEKVL